MHFSFLLGPAMWPTASDPTRSAKRRIEERCVRGSLGRTSCSTAPFQQTIPDQGGYRNRLDCQRKLIAVSIRSPNR
jgi:hypothetical protein